MKCRKCGAELLPDAQFCANCGTPVELEKPEPKDEFFDEPEQKRNNPLKKTGISVGTSFEVGGLLGAILNRRKKKQERE